MKKRIALWDNLKFLLIIFVVIGHYTQQFRADNEILQRIYVFIYSFHMPIFIFVTGLFSKKAVDEKNIKKALPYLTCFFATTLILFITKALLGWAPVFELFSPSGISWYLMSMFFMFLITMLIKDYKPQYIFVLSLIIGVMCGFCKTSNPDFFTWMRTLTFYPFFCLGYISDREKIEKATNKISNHGCNIFCCNLSADIFLSKASKQNQQIKYGKAHIFGIGQICTIRMGTAAFDIRNFICRNIFAY